MSSCKKCGYISSDQVNEVCSDSKKCSNRRRKKEKKRAKRDRVIYQQTPDGAAYFKG